jgi:UDP-N-acetyl-D-glucosamine dehydrogenase
MNCKVRDGLDHKIEDELAIVGVVGLGYVGLPLMRLVINAGYRAVGYDIDVTKIGMLRNNQGYCDIVSNKELEAWNASKAAFTTSPNDLVIPDIIIVCVPTPVTEDDEPDLQYVESTMETIAERLRPGQLVVLESTVYPTATREIVLPILERKGLKVDEEFFLAYSPERENPGSGINTAEIPKVVGAIGPKSESVALQFYRECFDEVHLAESIEVAEACKILENTYRMVNIALVNELNSVFRRMGIDTLSVIEAADTKPFGFQAFYPGPGVGGHCIMPDSKYMAWLAKRVGPYPNLIMAGIGVNETAVSNVVCSTIHELRSRGHASPLADTFVCVVGVAYKPDVPDTRESPGVEIIRRLSQNKIVASYHDPLVDTLARFALASEGLTPEFIEKQDCILITTNHSDIDYEMIDKHASLIIDTRNSYPFSNPNCVRI